MKTIFRNNMLLFKEYWKISKSYLILRLLTAFTITIETMFTIIFLFFFTNALFYERNVTLIIILLLVELTIMSITYLIRSLYDKKYTPAFEKKVFQEVRKNIYSTYINADVSKLDDPDYHDKYIRSLEVYPQKVIDSVDHVRRLIAFILNFIVVVVFLSSFTPFLVLLCLISAILQIIVVPKINRINYSEFLEKTVDNRKKAYIYRMIYDLNNKINLKVFNLKNMLFKDLKSANENVKGKIKKYSTRLIALDSIQAIVAAVSLMIIFVYVGIYYTDNTLSPGGYIAVLTASLQFLGVLGGMLMILPKFAENSLYVNDYLSFTNSAEGIETSNGDSIKEFNVLETNNVSFSYEEDNPVLINNNICVKKGEKIALVGFNGAGKTTLTNLLLRVYDPNSGEVIINGRNIKELETRKYREMFTVIPQKNQLYSVSVIEYILTRAVESDNDIEAVNNALKLVGMYDHIYKMKNNINSLITKEFDDDGIELSGGQIQKLLIARALVSKGEIVIIDEVLSSIDPIEEKNLFELIINVLSHKTIIYVSHKLFTTQHADKIYVMEQGNVVENGTHKELLAKKGTYYEMFEVQSEKYRF